MSADARQTLSEVERFLFHEAELLDDWRLEEWTALFSEDAAYLIPTTDIPEDASPRTHLFYVADDHYRLCARAKRLMKKTAYAEFPHSRMRRVIANVCVDRVSGDRVFTTCNFSASRTARGRTLTYVGRIKHELIGGPDGFRIREKRVLLDHDGLSHHGRITAPL